MRTLSTTRTLVTAGTLLVLSCVVGCGGGSGSSVTDDVSKSVTPEWFTSLNLSTDIKARAAQWHNLLHSSGYTGQLSVSFREAAAVRFDRTSGQWISKNGADVSVLNQLRAVVPAERVHRVMAPVSEAIVDEVRRRSAQVGTPIHDWNGVFRLHVADADVAEQVLAALMSNPLVDWAHPVPWPIPMDAPPFTGAGLGQSYLAPDLPGLNVKAAWDKKLSGEGQLILDEDYNWNFTHADLAIAPDVEDNFVFPDYLNVDEAIQHGTGMTGIIGAKNNLDAAKNQIGIKGIAWGADVRTQPLTDLVSDDGIEFAEIGSITAGLKEIFQKIYLGDTTQGAPIVIASGYQPASATGQMTNNPCYTLQSNNTWKANGCMPAEALSESATAIQDLTNDALIHQIIIEAAGNGALDFDAPTTKYFVGEPNLHTARTDAIMVGASTGAGMLDPADPLQKNQLPGMQLHPFSNCGQRIDVFAWGAGVVTTGYGDDKELTVPGDPNQTYTNTFGGTSAATAMIGGVVVLMQEYVTKLYTEPDYAAQEGVAALKLSLKPYEQVYLTAQQVREILTDPSVGNPQTDSGCKIGRQPDVGKALQKITEKMLTSDWRPTIAVKALGTKGKCVYTEDWSKECAEECLAAYAKKNYSFTDLPKICPKSGKMFAKAMDVDGVKDTNGVVDNKNGKLRADLVEWGRDGKWYLDLSGTNSLATQDGFGKWDLVLTPPAMEAGRLFPVVADYDSDGFADLALYNTDTGHWYIKYTTPEVLAGTFGNWDEDLDFKGSNPTLWKIGGRPEIGDYDGVLYELPSSAGTYRTSPTLDIALVNPDDGHWLISYAINDTAPRTHSAVLHAVPLLTKARLTEAPAWAYLPASLWNGEHYISYIVPDGLPDNGHLCGAAVNTTQLLDPESENQTGCSPDQLYGGSNTIVAPARYAIFDSDCVGLRTADSTWRIIDPLYSKVMVSKPAAGFGDASCRPIPADYDGDNIDDRAILCPNGTWKIAYTNPEMADLLDKDGFRLSLQLGGVFQSLPGRVYPGGVSYSAIKSLFSKYNFGCAKNKSCDIFNLPAPIGPYFAECLQLWGINPVACLKY